MNNYPVLFWEEIDMNIHPIYDAKFENGFVRVYYSLKYDGWVCVFQYVSLTNPSTGTCTFESAIDAKNAARIKVKKIIDNRVNDAVKYLKEYRPELLNE